MMKNMETRFRRPVHTGMRVTAKSWLLEESGRSTKVAGSLMDEDDSLLAEGKAELLVLNEDQMKRLGIS